MIDKLNAIAQQLHDKNWDELTTEYQNQISNIYKEQQT